ncbi:hypothetical protein SAMN04487968_106169 [Nocardioides terrae]|uniref:Uncharacterized protein n=1 Tax=Nocardioides terrae TaxID=574651 RepID=A0A1I1J301_9ACTN|nr:hypothetical protein [Nocardioides terrae]SFC42979.1 hypothetical protein SAMN04487968_106169 [Nocardioides terrae]
MTYSMTYSEALVLFLAITMLVILTFAGLVLLYAAFPHRGERVPVVPWLGDALERATDAAPVLEEDDTEAWLPGR